jgi:hypothetical protein
VETTLGWFYRKLRNLYSEEAAREALSRANMLSQPIEDLRQVFLPFIDSSQIEKVEYLGAGANGLVFKGVWNHDGLQTNVALKRPKQNLEETEARQMFLSEV